MQFLLWTFSPAVSPPCENLFGSILEVEISWSSVVGAPTSLAFARPSGAANQSEKSSFGEKKLTWLVGFNDFLCSSPFGEMIQFD